jgi:hypothetical protein
MRDALDAATTHAEDATKNLHTLIASVAPTGQSRSLPAALALQMIQAQAACAQAWATVAIAREQERQHTE